MTLTPEEKTQIFRDNRDKEPHGETWIGLGAEAQLAKLAGKEEVREKLVKICGESPPASIPVDEILALLQAQVEEAHREWVSALKEHGITVDSPESLVVMVKELVEEAKKEKEEEFKLRFNPDYLDFKKGVAQERERIFELLEDDSVFSHDVEYWGDNGRKCKSNCPGCRLWQSLGGK